MARDYFAEMYVAGLLADASWIASSRHSFAKLA